MTENNKLYKALDQLQFNTDNSDLKALETAIFTDKNLENIKADEGSDLYNFLSGKKKDGSEYTINDIINNTYNLSEAGITNFLINNKVYKKDQLCSEHGFVAALLNGEAGHFCTYENKKVILNSSNDGRQFNQCCGIHAIEGVLIAEALKSLNDNDKKYNDFVSKYKNAFLDDEKEMTPEEKANREKNRKELKKILEQTKDIVLEEQRKILFKMEILDALNNLPETVLSTVYSKKEDGTYEINGLSKLYKLYFEEFQARCAALQAVKQELGLKLDKVKLDKVPEAPKVETQKQSIHTAPQQIKQEKEIKTEAPKVEIQQTKIKKEEVSTHKVVIENPEEIKKSKIEQQKEGENDKKFNLPEPKQENEIVNTQEVIEGRQECDTPSKEEPNVSTTTQSSAASSTSTSKTPRYKVLEKRGTKEEKDAGFETYDVNNQPIDIEDESVKLYNKFLDQVLEEFKKEEKIVNIVSIKKKVEEKLFACFSIRNEKGETISKDHYSEKDEKDIELAKKDYKYTAENSELIKNRFNAIKEALKEYNERLAGANKEMREKFPQQEAITAKQ